TFYEGKIVVGRLSEANDILPFTISEKLLKAYNINLKSGEDAYFGGELRSYNKVIDGKSRLILSFFVKEILAEENFIDNTNQLSLTGFICKTPVFRTTPFNRQICDILLAVNRPNFNKSDYIPCILWGRNAKFIQGQKVGTKIELVGRIQSRIYRKEISEGVFEERTAYEVSCQKINVIAQNQQQSQSLA
ncbi:MAG: single-stranded DNA-binding protein, partial [Clostridia bacterium]|nr:single-stranded DNA-binding protein [Clostridia bacterium]